jgi:mono/diheme cytochrome c family protein
VPDKLSGKKTFLKYCASCHGEDAKGNNPAAVALKPPPSDLTTLARRYDGKFLSGFVGALVKFGRNLAAHGSDGMPVWGSRFRDLDPTNRDLALRCGFTTVPGSPRSAVLFLCLRLFIV